MTTRPECVDECLTERDLGGIIGTEVFTYEVLQRLKVCRVALSERGSFDRKSGSMRETERCGLDETRPSMRQASEQRSICGIHENIKMHRNHSLRDNYC